MTAGNGDSNFRAPPHIRPTIWRVESCILSIVWPCPLCDVYHESHSGYSAHRVHVRNIGSTAAPTTCSVSPLDDPGRCVGGVAGRVGGTLARTPRPSVTLHGPGPSDAGPNACGTVENGT